MPLITVSRGSKSGGEALAHLLADKLNCPNLVSREVLVRVSQESGIHEEELFATMHETPSFLSRSTWGKRRLYLTLIRAALLEHAVNGCMVYHGNAGQFLLQDVDWVLKVRLIAPLSLRLTALMETQKMDVYSAKLYIQKVDEDRRRWVKYLYSESWDDPAHFDLVVNLKHVSMETAAATICRMADSPEFERTPERVLELADKALAARVQAALEAHPKTRDADLHVRAENRAVHLSGEIKRKGLLEEITRVAAGVPGVARVETHLTNR
ncbi:MAG: BON domain-containing protein [Candidatus Zixiibacteriota bacterium]|nr:MAG: BON domain-containing protein [candidate division Zixibacteria bacterium]